MDIEKLLKFGTEYFSDYFSVFISTLRSPILRFQPLSNDSVKLIIPKNLSSYFGPELNPKLFGFMIISIFIGSILNSVVFGQPSSDVLVRDTIIILVMWFLYSLAIFGICKVLRGQGTFLETISVSLQLLAVIFVVSNLALLLWQMIFLPILFPFIARQYRDLLLYNPELFYYIVQAILMFIYLPIALKGVHNFNRVQLFFTLVVPLIFAVSFISSYINTISIIRERPHISYTPTAKIATPKATMTPTPSP